MIRYRLLAPGAALALAIGFTLSLAACGAGDQPALSQAAQAGRDVAADNGCMSCHGAQGQGGVGPAWTGLAGSQVTLEDGTTVVADDAYLQRAIADPEAERVDGYAVVMPTNTLDQGQIEAIVVYIKELS